MLSCMPTISALRRLALKIKASLHCVAKACAKMRGRKKEKGRYTDVWWRFYLWRTENLGWKLRLENGVAGITSSLDANPKRNTTLKHHSLRIKDNEEIKQETLEVSILKFEIMRHLLHQVRIPFQTIKKQSCSEYRSAATELTGSRSACPVVNEKVFIYTMSLSFLMGLRKKGNRQESQDSQPCHIQESHPGVLCTNPPAQSNRLMPELYLVTLEHWRTSFQQGLVAHTCDPSTLEAGAGLWVQYQSVDLAFGNGRVRGKSWFRAEFQEGRSP